MRRDEGIFEQLSPECQREEQWRRVQRLLSHAYAAVPFYRRRFEAIGAKPADFKSLEDFESFPVLTRDDVLANAESMLAYPRECLTVRHSGGSTGHPLTLYGKKSEMRRVRTYRHRGNRWLNSVWLVPSFRIWGADYTTDVPVKPSVWRVPTRLHYNYGFHRLTRDDLWQLARDLLAVRPGKILGFPSLLRALAQFLIEEGMSVSRPPRVIVSTAETLTEADRHLIEEGLGGTVYDRYGSTENSMIAMECLERTGLHVLTDHVYLEILNRGKPAGYNQPGHVVLTDLDSLAMPLIRYRNEDIAAWSEKKCPCGRRLPMLAAVYGRQTDFIFDGAGIAYPGLDLINPLRPIAEGGRIRQFQITQDRLGQLEVLAVPGPVMEADDIHRIATALTDWFNGPIGVQVRVVQEIPPEPSGKTRFVKSAMPYTGTSPG